MKSASPPETTCLRRARPSILDVSIPPPTTDAPADRPPVHIELIHNVSRPIRTLTDLNREQQHLDRTREKLLHQ